MTDKKIQLLIPKNQKNKNEDIDLSIVVPALNEEITIAEFIDWCFEGIKKCKCSAEIIIVDSSTDSTAVIALEKGARVLKAPKKGLGAAYKDAIPYIRGKLVLMGDCDLTYDFRSADVFFNAYKNGFEYIMGSRFMGSIEDGSMPKLHRYFGTPLTTWLLNKIYKTKFSDIHCGMRGISLEALKKINLTSNGWEYASEMVLKSKLKNLKTCEVPVTFFKDRDGRFSHHVRSGFWSPWYAGWINLKAMLAYKPDFIFATPGAFVFFIGIFLLLLSYPGNISFKGVHLSNYSMLFSMCFIILGFSFTMISTICRVLNKQKTNFDNFLINKISLEKGIFLFFIFFIFGLSIEINFIHDYILNNYYIYKINQNASLGILLIIISFQILAISLILESIRRNSNQ